MHILADKNTNVVIDASEVITEIESGFETVKNGETIVYMMKTSAVLFEVDDVPSDFKGQKYIYTPENGFEINMEYVPYIPTEQRIADLEAQNAALFDAINTILGI